MRIAVPSMDDRGLRAPVAEHFGQAPYFTIADTESGGVTTHKSPGHVDGKTPAQHLAELDVQVVLAGGMGGRAIQLLEALGMEVFLEAGGSVEEALAAHKQGHLPRAADAGPCSEPCPPGGARHGG